MNGDASGGTPGVYRQLADGSLRPVHEYLDEHYELSDIAELLGIGTLDGSGCTLHLTTREQRLLKVTADAESFDHAPEFITLCLEIAALDATPDEDVLKLVSLA